MRRVVVDTGAFYAALNSKDQHHEETALLFEQAVQETWRLLTSNFVLSETHAFPYTRSLKPVACFPRFATELGGKARKYRAADDFRPRFS